MVLVPASVNVTVAVASVTLPRVAVIVTVPGPEALTVRRCLASAVSAMVGAFAVGTTGGAALGMTSGAGAGAAGAGTAGGGVTPAGAGSVRPTDVVAAAPSASNASVA